MPRRADISSLLITGDSPIVIGQAAEFSNLELRAAIKAINSLGSLI